MSTLASMKARIADEIMRDDLTSQIALAITDAIKHHQPKRYYFNEKDSITFTTATGYTGTTLYTIDAVFVTVNGREWLMKQISPVEWRILNYSGTTGQPYCWTYFQEEMRLYPIADQTYTIRLQAHYKIAEPASDDESGNVWMMDGEEVVRHRAKMLLYRDVLLDPQKAEVCFLAELEAMGSLNATTNKMASSGIIEPMAF